MPGIKITFRNVCRQAVSTSRGLGKVGGWRLVETLFITVHQKNKRRKEVWGARRRGNDRLIHQQHACTESLS